MAHACIKSQKFIQKNNTSTICFFLFYSALTIALIDTLSDKNDKVRDSVAQSIFDTGKKLPQQTVILCTNYLNKHQKLPETHRASILRAIERIIHYQQQNQQEGCKTIRC